jgi:phospholipid-transporting ATPase
MSDDFVRLVSTANPAAGRSNGPGTYPPQSRQHGGYAAPAAQLDPFFDDDDLPPDSAFDASRDDLTKHAPPPAGNHDDAVKTWTFDDDEPAAGAPSLPYAGASAFPGTTTPAPAAPPPPRRKRRWRWPWQADDTPLGGERVIALNDAGANVDFGTNYVSTSKYNLASFMPKFLLGPSPSPLRSAGRC